MNDTWVHYGAETCSIYKGSERFSTIFDKHEVLSDEEDDEE